ncbi:MAG: glycosyltransferase family 2 protein [Verrucomicrobia bacterium]|nr:glycosyltransferase family 2 protein [Verrucomicrobiota bacterium]MCH8511790.1 glycosyltransferase family 2 protein [Kiritimatiellia bacterium]
MNPMFSVIIPTHGRLDYLAEALQSVLAQTESDWECLVISDLPAEFEAAQSLVDGFKDSRLRFFRGDRPGANASRNKGMDQSTGSIYCFLDDDDLWTPDKLSQHRLAHLQADLVYSATFSRYDKPFVYDLYKEKKGQSRDQMLEAMKQFRGCPHSASCCTLDRKALGEARWDEQLSSFQDWDFWFQILVAGPRTVKHIPKPLAIIREHSGTRTSRGLEKRLENIQRLSEKYSKLLTPSVVQWRIQQETFLHLRTLSAQGNRGQAIQVALYQWKFRKESSQAPLPLAKVIRALLSPKPNSRMGFHILRAWYRLTRRKHALRRIPAESSTL